MTWQRTVCDLESKPRDRLTGEELTRLAEGLFWLDRIEESIEARVEAHRRLVSEGDMLAAALAAWRLFYEHWLVGETVIARGWLETARDTHADSGDSSAGWLALADADVATAEGDIERACELARSALLVARSVDDVDLTAMALQGVGRAEIALGETRSGFAKLDRAMILVIGNRLDPLFTGWVYCNVVSASYAVGDLRRASEWSDSALRWCDSLREGRLYPGLCRVYAAEIAILRGRWPEAEALAQRACAELVAHDERYAAAAFYVAGEAARLRGHGEAAIECFRQAHRLGHPAQPGLALTEHSQGRSLAALRSLRSALDPGPSGHVERAHLLTALATIAVATDDAESIEVASSAAEQLNTEAVGSVAGFCAFIAGAVADWRGDPPAALRHLRRSFEVFRDIGLPYQAAHARLRMGNVASSLGDTVTARMEWTAAAATFDELGATPDAEEVARLLVSGTTLHRAQGHLLTMREIDVLQLVAEGRTNPQVAERLDLSRHTVARHLANIYTKLGVRSRAAATAWASEQGILSRRD